MWCKKGLDKQTFKDFEWIIEKHDPSLPPNFNSAMNEAIRTSEGELIVILQDYTLIPEDGLQKFWDAYKENPTVFWTAPLGKVIQETDEPKWDWRIEKSPDMEMEFINWEIDWACAPKYALEEIGGFDEELDKQWGFDNVNVGLRAILGGFQIRCLPDNRAIAYDHDEVMRHPYREKQDATFHNIRLEQIRSGLKLNYLSYE